MPIYAYQCGDCGFQQDVLQKISEPPRTTCPSCGHESFSKQLSAPAFQLKGTGWYVTDFRDNGKKPADKSGNASSGEAGSGKGAAEAGSASGASSASAASAPAAATPAPAPAPAPAKAGD
ncbi:MAG: zinc ribbon domain-containing protein [Lautropia sp.]|nr:zinc ribbon domain-containing protein [Lautropia sp.]